MKTTHRAAGATPPPPPVVDLEVQILPVRTAADRDAFIRFQGELLGGDPYYVPPIVAERRDFLDRKKNPFLKYAELELFLATRHGRTVGRIAAISDPRYNQFHNTEAGFFGMFDAVNDPAVARALLDTAADFARRRGMKQLMGPVNLSFNHDCGVLVEGFEHPPAMMMPYNPPYYGPLLEACGLKKAKDLFSFELSTSVAPPEKVIRIAERLRAEDGIVIRPLDMKDLAEETRRIKAIYNAMLERSWGFVPMSEDEFDMLAARLRPLVQVRPELCLIAEVKGEPVAFSLTLPDSNVGLKAANGRLTQWGLPVGLAKLLWATRQIDRLRVVLFGVKPGFRKRGIDALLCLDTLRAARELGYSGGELGWTAEDNELLNRAIESIGARRYKTYRIFHRSV